MIKASIVIRSYNEEKHIERLLAAIADQQVDFKYEIILVDSGSTDNTRQIALRHPVRLVSIKSAEFTFGRALNKGLEQARGECAVLVSAHCYPENPFWLREMMAPFADPGIAIVYGKQRGNAQTRFSEHQVFKAWFPEESNFEQRSPFCNNANAAIRRSVWQQMPYDETLSGLEDLDWAHKVIQQQGRVAYQAAAGVVHVHEEKYNQIRNRYRREAMALRRIFPDARFSVLEFFKLVILNAFSDWVQAARVGEWGRQALDITLFRANQFWGTYLGYHSSRALSPELRTRFYYPDRLRQPALAKSPAALALKAKSGA